MAHGALDNEIQFLPGVGPKRAKLLAEELQVATFGDLLRLYPFRYVDRSSVQNISDVVSDSAYVQILAKVVRVSLLGQHSQPLHVKEMTATIEGRDDGQIKFNTVKRLSAIVADATGEMEIIFFKGVKYMWNRLIPGANFIFFGKPTVFNGRVNMVHPEVDNLPQAGTLGTTGTLTGVYPGTEKLKNAGVTNKVMNRLMGLALERCLGGIRETLPDYILKEKGLVPLRFALRNIHFPSDATALAKATYRLKFEELFFLQLSLLKQKYVRSRSEVGLMMPKVGEAFNACYNALPFDLTGAQKRVIKEIRSDMMSGHQMNRLLQGDVGSGKTMVAVLSCLIAIGNGYQACIMAPTEVLAQQHYHNISKYLAPTRVSCALLTGSTKVSERRTIHSSLQDGSLGIIVGTHALIEDDVKVLCDLPDLVVLSPLQAICLIWLHDEPSVFDGIPAYDIEASFGS